MPLAREIARAWDAEAPIRAKELAADDDPAYRALTFMVERIVVALTRNRRAKVLDAGCGLGFMARHLADAGHRVTGADLSATSVDLARRLHQDGVREVEFDTCDVRNPKNDWQDEYDIVIANMVLHNTPDLKLFLKGCYEMLKPLGLLLIVLTEPTAYLEKHGVEHEYRHSCRFDFPVRPRRTARSHPPVPYWHRPTHFYVNALALAGFGYQVQGRPEQVGAGRGHDILTMMGQKLSTGDRRTGSASA